MSFLFATVAVVSIVTITSLKIEIDTAKPTNIVDQNFVSVAIDSSIIRKKFKHINSPKLLALAKGLTGNALRPEFYLRIGGGLADESKFDPTMEIFNVTEFEELCNFVYELRWKLIFDLNSLLRNRNGSWDPTNAMELIEFTVKEGCYLHYELGNEPDLYPKHKNISVSPEELAYDFQKLRKILDELTRRQSMLFGPDIATLTRYHYFERFLNSLEKGVVNAITFHHYYSSSENITSSNFTDISYLDGFLSYTLHAWDIIKSSIRFSPCPPVWIGETSSTYGGGSDIGESYVAGFLWLDKLGLAAQLNISVVIRQTLIGGRYALLNKNFYPTPDYWITLFHKRLVGQVVLNVTGYLQYNRETRVYAHCMNQFGGHGYKSNQIVLIILNLSKQNFTKIEFQSNEFQNLLIDQYLFSPHNGKLEDTNVNLNSRLLKMVDATTLPDLEPVRIRQPIFVPPTQYGFYVLVGSHAEACIQPY